MPTQVTRIKLSSATTPDMSVSSLNTNVIDELVDARNLASELVEVFDELSDTLSDSPENLTRVRAAKNNLAGLHAIVRSFPTCEKGAA